MNREDIIRMAREAGCTANEANAWGGYLERFATLVATAEREACAAMFAAEDFLFEGRHIAAAIRARGNS